MAGTERVCAEAKRVAEKAADVKSKWTEKKDEWKEKHRLRGGSDEEKDKEITALLGVASTN